MNDYIRLALKRRYNIKDGYDFIYASACCMDWEKLSVMALFHHWEKVLDCPEGKVYLDNYFSYEHYTPTQNFLRAIDMIQDDYFDAGIDLDEDTVHGEALSIKRKFLSYIIETLPLMENHILRCENDIAKYKNDLNKKNRLKYELSYTKRDYKLLSQVFEKLKARRNIPNLRTILENSIFTKNQSEDKWYAIDPEAIVDRYCKGFDVPREYDWINDCFNIALKRVFGIQDKYDFFCACVQYIDFKYKFGLLEVFSKPQNINKILKSPEGQKFLSKYFK